MSAVPSSQEAALAFSVSSSPHINNSGLTTHRLMWDVLLALLPVFIAACWVFGLAALQQVGLSVLACVVTEYLCSALRGRKASIADGSTLVTGVILGLSLPWGAPPFVPLIAGLIAIGLGKAVFGGLGYNMFNPAMVGRAFVMISFSGLLGASAFVLEDGGAILSQATPLTAAGNRAPMPDLWPLFLGTTNGSLGETSILACLIGGIYLCVRRTASWEIPAAVLVTMALLAGLGQLIPQGAERLPALGLTIPQQLMSGSLVFGAFFIATDPVSSPMSRLGKVVFGIIIAFLVWTLRVFSNYPEGLMFAILIANALVPLVNRWTVPTPVGGATK